MKTPNYFDKNSANLRFGNCSINEDTEEIEIEYYSLENIALANMQTKVLGNGVIAIMSGNIQRFAINIDNFATLYKQTDGGIVTFDGQDKVLDFFFNP